MGAHAHRTSRHVSQGMRQTALEFAVLLPLRAACAARTLAPESVAPPSVRRAITGQSEAAGIDLRNVVNEVVVTLAPGVSAADLALAYGAVLVRQEEGRYAAYLPPV